MGMEHSRAVTAAIETWCDRMSSGDVDGVAATIVDDPDAFPVGTQRIGSGREEWLGSIREMAEMGVAWSSSDVRAWETADAGFAVGEVTATLPDGTRLPMRITAFLVREGDSMRIFNIHFSWAVPDEIGLPHAIAWREELGLAAAR